MLLIGGFLHITRLYSRRVCLDTAKSSCQCSHVIFQNHNRVVYKCLDITAPQVGTTSSAMNDDWFIGYLTTHFIHKLGYMALNRKGGDHMKDGNHITFNVTISEFTDHNGRAV
jgi:hypothetical protein